MFLCDPSFQWQGNSVGVPDVYLLENCEPRRFLGSGSLVVSDFERDIVAMPGRNGYKLVCLVLKTMICADAPLPFVQLDDEGKVECTTLSEAIQK